MNRNESKAVGLPANSRRSFLRNSACGFGALACSALATEKSPLYSDDSPNALAGLHHIAKAKRIIFLFMQGGVSQVDSFDYKPDLAKWDGQSIGFEDARVFANTGNRQSNQRVMNSPWKFKRYGQTGRWVSSLFPEVAKHIDDLCLVHSMHTQGVAHGPATLFLHCGATNFVRPSFGSWLLYGLGSENQDLPGFVSIAPSIGNGGARNFGNAFLPAKYQGTAIGVAGAQEDRLTIPFLKPAYRPADEEKTQSMIRRFQAIQSADYERESEIEAMMASYELAWRMQSEAPQRLDLEQETPATLALYGIGQKATDDFGRKCLLARRLSESGVRFVQVNYGDNSANPAWDQHSNLPKHADHAFAVDRPIAGLLQDLKQRGLLEDTLVWWGGEFGRTPYAEKNGTGRDHNPGGFTMWMAGGGVRAGYSHGATDEFGSAAISDKVHLHDLHATLFHLLGIDHERLTFSHSGRDYRLTDVFGRVVPELIQV